MGCLYILESPSGKRYVGITSKTFDQRWRAHKMRVQEGRNQALQAAIRKYGADTFIGRALVIANDWTYLCELERKAIVAFGTRPPNGYNLTSGGEGAQDVVHTAMAAANMSRGQRKRFQNAIERAKLNELAKAARVANSRKWAKVRAAKIAASRTPEAIAGRKAAHSAATKIAMQRPEVREKVLQCAARRAASATWRQRVSIGKKGKSLPPATDEARKNHSEGAKRMWARRKLMEVR